MAAIKLNAAVPASAKRPDYDFRNRVRSAAHGRWREVLQKLGIPAELLSGEACECPACGHSLRFNLTSDRGEFTCGPTTSDGFGLLAHLAGVGFWQAVRLVGDAVRQRERPKHKDGGRIDWRGIDVPEPRRVSYA